MKFTIRKLTSLTDIPENDWNRLIDNSTPFLRHEFLAGLEQHTSLNQHGWIPNHLAVYSGEQIVGALPLYMKTNSTGEFVFDWNWADAYENAGGQYYPKLVSAIPFTPVCSNRLLVNANNPDKNLIEETLLRAAHRETVESDISGLHFLFPNENNRLTLEQHGFLMRLTCQFYWINQNYENFDDFLKQLNSKKRKQIKKERRYIQDSGIVIETLEGNEVSPEQWVVFNNFYQSTFHRKWGEPRLTQGFFQHLSAKLPRETLLFLASLDGEYIAGAFAMRGEHDLFGRHWGCNKQFRFLHFEMCYYQTIEYCIRYGLKRIDAGVQGEHKIWRGFRAVPAWSAHRFSDSTFQNAIQNFLMQERRYMEQYIQDLSEHLPYKKFIQLNP